MKDEAYAKAIIIKAIDKCRWRKRCGGVDVCQYEILPCEKCIKDGKCKAIIETLKRDGRSE